MIYENVELHNVAEVHPASGGDGVRLQRYPEAVRVHLTQGGQGRALNPDNSEIRFLSDGAPTRVTLSSEGQTNAMLFYGDFDARQRFVIGKEPMTIEIGAPGPRLLQLDPQYWQELSFSPRVYRLILGRRRQDPLVFHGIEGENVRPPEPEDLPSLRHLAYGTSITHGADAEAPHLTYAAQTAWHLGADLINLGLGGSAHCEPEVADYIAQRDDWHIATLALSVNMQGFPLDRFYKRVSYMVNTVAGQNQDKPVACITLYTYYRDLGIETVSKHGTAEDYRQALRDAVAAYPHDNVHLIEGRKILTDIRGLTLDLIHPGGNGMIEMGYNLARELKPLIKD